MPSESPSGNLVSNKPKKSASSKGSLENAPLSAHYKAGHRMIEPLEVIEDWNLNFNLASALKYIGRANTKGQKIADLKKAIWYLEHELEHVEHGCERKVIL